MFLACHVKCKPCKNLNKVINWSEIIAIFVTNFIIAEIKHLSPESAK